MAYIPIPNIVFLVLSIITGIFATCLYFLQRERHLKRRAKSASTFNEVISQP